MRGQTPGRCKILPCLRHSGPEIRDCSGGVHDHATTYFASAMATAKEEAPLAYPRCHSVFVVCTILVLVILGVIGAIMEHSNRTAPAASATSAPSTASATPVATPQESYTSPAQVAKTTPTPEPKATATPTPTPTPTPFKTRVVKLDLEGEEHNPTYQTAMGMLKKMKWSLSGDPTIAAKQDAEQFLSVASGMKNYPNFYVKGFLMLCAADSFDNSVEIAKQLRASGMSEEKISELHASNEPNLPFANNPMHTYSNTIDEILGGSFEEYWAKAIGKRPESNSGGLFSGDGGIREINDIVTKMLNDPESYKFDHFKANPDPNGAAWKVDYYFRAKNAFGALILNHYYFYIRDGKVVDIKEPKD